MSSHHDQEYESYLWDPNATPDAEIENLERLLKPHGAHVLELATRALPLPRRPRSLLLRRSAYAAAASLTMLGCTYLLHAHRLNWTDGNPWPVTTVRENGTTEGALLEVGERIVTASDQTATLSAARIGKVVVAPNSAVRLVRTQKGRHRIELERGRMHAKVWAPPSYFGVAHGETRVIDMGCEFDLNIESPGNGFLSVTSGWVIYWHGDRGVFVPEHYSLAFSEAGAQIPSRVDAANDFRGWVNELDTQLASNPAIDHPRAVELVAQITAGARDEDYFSLLTLLGRYPRLAQSALYPRLAMALKVSPDDELHRARWAQGEPEPQNQWWNKLPKQPKEPHSWWWNWKDGF
jgi:hypothetical protein